MANPYFSSVLASRKMKYILQAIGGASVGVLCLFLFALILLVTPIIALLWFLSDKVLWRTVGKSFLYNMSWEDPRIDSRTLNLNSSDWVITLCSAGDNALHYVLEGAKVTAVDLNPCQIALCELKCIAIKLLCYDEFFAIFAESDINLLKKRYFEVLRKELSASSKEFWDIYIYRIRSFMYAGSSGKLAFIVFRILFPIIRLGWIRSFALQEINYEQFSAKLAKEQKKIGFLCWIGELILLKSLCGLAGVPKAQLKLGLHRDNNLQTIARRLLTSDLASDNYFYSGYLTGKWTELNCPAYLKRENFDILKKHLLNGYLHLYCSSLVDHLKTVKNCEFTVASLLDHMDWMQPSEILSEMRLLLNNLNCKTGRIFWRSFSEEVHSPVLAWLKPERVNDHDDRVGMYFSTWVFYCKNLEYSMLERKNEFYSDGSNFGSFLSTGLKIMTFPVKKFWLSISGKQLSHQETMEAFYYNQRKGYDIFREKMLHARPLLMDIIPLSICGNMTWVDVGGGTARNLEFLGLKAIRAHFRKIYIVDVSKSLLLMAAERIRLIGLTDIVQLIEMDFTRKEVLNLLPEKESVDLITFSYSLSMIQDHEAVKKNCLHLLKKDGKGILGIADFFEESKSRPQNVGKALFKKAESSFHRWWLAHDGVHMLSPALISAFECDVDKVWFQGVKGSVPFIPFLRPFHGALAAVTKVS